MRTPDAGTVRVLGLDPAADPGAVRQRVGVQLQQAVLPNRMKVSEAMAVFAAAYRGHADPDQLLAEWGLTEQRRTAFGNLSGGQKQRLFIALALLGQPEVVVLDELTTGLDPAARRDTWALVAALRERGVTVVLVTHAMDEAEALCDRLVVIDRRPADRPRHPGRDPRRPPQPRGRLPPPHRTRPRKARLMTTQTLAVRPNPLTALATLTRVETLLLLREPAAVLFTLALPLVLLVLNGSDGNAPNPRFGGAGTIDVLMAGYLVYVMATSAIMGLGETLADYRDRGILRRLRITPLRPWQILSSHALTHLAMSVVGVVLLVTVGALRRPATGRPRSAPRLWP